MKIITLNIWGGLAGREELLSFFEKHKSDTDIFCLQEVWTAPYTHIEGQVVGGRNLEHDKLMIDGLDAISGVLTNHNPYFRPHHGDDYGLLMFVKKDLKVEEEGELFVHKHKGYIPEGDVGLHARNIQFVKTSYEGKPLCVINFHGLWNGMGKDDSEDRLEQSRKISSFIKDLSGGVILGGDFNLNPNTESMKILEDAGLRNLVKDYGVTSTRTPLYDKSGKFADYIMTRDVEVKDFQVLPDVVSDHSPLYVKV